MARAAEGGAVRFWRTFRQLARPAGGHELLFHAAQLETSSNFRIAMDAAGRPAMLIRTVDAVEKIRPRTELRHLSLWPQTDCEVSEGGSCTTGCFAVLRCKADEPDLQRLFADVLESWVGVVGDAPTSDRVAAKFERLAQLFEAFSQPSSRDVKGLWGELFLVAVAAEPELLVRAWRSNPLALYDFEDGVEMLEVKTTAASPRRHDVSLRQMSPPIGTTLVLASVLASPKPNGHSVADLGRILKARLSEPDLRLRVDEIIAGTLGDGWTSASETFDASAAMRSLRFYDGTRIPCVDRLLPVEVSEVRFKVELDGVSSLDDAAMRSAGRLFAAAVSAGPRVIDAHEGAKEDHAPTSD